MTTLTPQEVADDLRLACTESVLRLLRSGDLPGFKAGRLWRIDSDDLEAWKRRPRVKAAAPAKPSDPNRIAPRSPRSQAALERHHRSD